MVIRIELNFVTNQKTMRKIETLTQFAQLKFTLERVKTASKNETDKSARIKATPQTSNQSSTSRLVFDLQKKVKKISEEKRTFFLRNTPQHAF